MGNLISLPEEMKTQDEIREPLPETVYPNTAKEPLKREAEFEVDESTDLNLETSEVGGRKELELNISSDETVTGQDPVIVWRHQSMNELKSIKTSSLSNIETKGQVEIKKNYMHEQESYQMLRIGKTEVESTQNSTIPQAEVKVEVKEEYSIKNEHDSNEYLGSAQADYQFEVNEEAYIKYELESTQNQTVAKTEAQVKIKQENDVKLESFLNLTNSEAGILAIKEEHEIISTSGYAVQGDVQPSDAISTNGQETLATNYIAKEELKSWTPKEMLPSVDVASLSPNISSWINQQITMWKNQQELIQVQDGQAPSSNVLQYLKWKPIKIDLPEIKKIVRTTMEKTPETSYPPSAAKKPRIENANSVTQNNHVMQIPTESKAPAAARVTSIKQATSTNRNTSTTKLCEPNETLRTLEHKKMYQCTTIDQLRSIPRPGSSIHQLKYFTSRLQDYVDTLKRIDQRFMHSPSIMKMVCAQLEPHMVWSWCEYAAQNAKNGKPIILTMLEFLNYKVRTGMRYWYPYTKEAANRKRMYSDISK